MKSPNKQPDGANKIRIAYFAPDFVYWSHVKMESESVACVIVPMPSKRAALAKKRWEGMTREKRAEIIAKKLYDLDTARAERVQASNNRNIRRDSFLYDREVFQNWDHRSNDTTRLNTEGLTVRELYLVRGFAVLSLLEGQP